MVEFVGDHIRGGHFRGSQSVYFALAVAALLFVGISPGLAIFPIQEANAAILIFIQDQASCEDSPVSGAWDSGTNTCTLINGLTIPSGDEVEVSPGITVVLPAGQDISLPVGAALAIASGGTLNIEGHVRNEGGITNSGTVNVSNDGNDSIGLLLDGGDSLVTNTNSGTINVVNSGTGSDSYGIYAVGGGFINNSGAIAVGNSGGDSFGISLNGFINNSGSITVGNSGTGSVGILVIGTGSNFNNTNSGIITIENSGDDSSGILISHQDGSMTNSGSITVGNSGGDSFGISLNGFLFPNSGIITIENTGTDSVGISINNAGIDNSGAIAVGNTGTDSVGISHRGTGSIIHNTDAGDITILNSGSVGIYLDFDADIINDDSGTIQIYGVLDINHTNSGIVNDGQINIKAGGELHNAGSIDNTNGSIIQECNSIYSGNAPVGNAIEVETCDTTAPVITILGSNPVTVLLGQPYTDAGVTVTDDTDPSPTLNTVSTVNTALAGTYTVTYTAEDEAGNISTATRTVNVISASTAIQNLIDNIKSQVTDKNVKSSLLGPLKEAQKVLTDKVTSNDNAACDKLANFIANVNSKDASGKLSSTLAQQYRDIANAIMSSLGC